MATDYEKFYQKNPHGLGDPTEEFVEFFAGLEYAHAEVLDVGCGQGRDALFIARLGHAVTAVDLSPAGTSDLQADASAEGLRITTVVADIRDYQTADKFDVIVIDRTLHMLNSEERVQVLRTLLTATRDQSYVLIADERSNLPAFRLVFENDRSNWTFMLDSAGNLFARCG